MTEGCQTTVVGVDDRSSMMLGYLTRERGSGSLECWTAKLGDVDLEASVKAMTRTTTTQARARLCWCRWQYNQEELRCQMMSCFLKEGGGHKQDDGIECKCVLSVSVGRKDW